MAIRKTSGKKKPTVRKPAKPSVRRPAKASVRKPAKPVARKPAARKPARPAVRKTTAARKPAAPVSRTPVSPIATTPTPAPRPTPSAPTGGFQNDNAGSSGTQPPQQPSFYRQYEQPLATHTVKEGETLSHIALRYYGNASEKHSMHIYNANRATIGGDPNMILAGQELTIPKPPTD